MKKRKLLLSTTLSVVLLTSFMEANGIITNEPTIVEASTKKSTLKKINQSIAKALKEDRGWAEGKLDENGNPTANGTPNPAFDYSKYISKAKYTKEGRGVIYVNSNFFALNEKTRKKYMTTAQNIILLGAADYKNISTDTYVDSIFVQVKYGKNHIGRSGMLNHHKFKWYR